MTTTEIGLDFTLQKETKGTYVYGCPDGVITTIYIKKEAFDKPAPREIRVLVTS